VCPDFLVKIYMRRRAVGEKGQGDTPPPTGGGVPHRICVDGVESAHHRQRLVDFCAAHRERWVVAHDKDGRHAPPQHALAVFQAKKAVDRVEVGEIAWQAGPLESVGWNGEFVQGLLPTIECVRWVVEEGKIWRGALMSWRIASADPYPAVLAFMLRRASTADTSGPFARSGQILAEFKSDPAGRVHWAAVTGLGVVLTGWP
jgi:hypothetical protein